jgi:hypothetical protein
MLIAGEAGIGKIRLAEELIEWASRQGTPSCLWIFHQPRHPSRSVLSAFETPMPTATPPCLQSALKIKRASSVCQAPPVLGYGKDSQLSSQKEPNMNIAIRLYPQTTPSCLDIVMMRY